VQLEHGAMVEGVVVDQAGKPIQGAQVTAMLHGVNSKRAVSDEHGRFRIRGLYPGEYYVDAATPTHASSAAHLQLEHGAQVEVRLVLEPARIAGVVVDQDGEPVFEATVRAIARTGYVPFRLEEMTDARGHFDLGPLQVGEYDLYASWPGVERDHDAPPTARVRSSDSELRLVVTRPSRVCGRVLLDGEPVRHFGASLLHANEMPGSRAIEISDADGRFMLFAQPGSWRLALLGAGTKLKIVDDITVNERKQIDVGDITMERGQRVSGHVRDTEGRPVAGARVKIGWGADLHANQSRVRQWFHGEYDTTTNDAGAFLFDGISQPELARVQPLIFATHHSVGASYVRSLPEGDASVDFVLLSTGAIDGFVEGAQGRHRFVEAAAQDEPKRARWMGTVGEFRFESLPPGEYAISLSGMGDEPVISERVIVAAGQRAKVRLVMKSSTAVRISIRVPRGRERDLRIERIDDVAGKPVGRFSALMDGRVTFGEVEPGEYRATLDGITWTQFVVVPTDPPEQTLVLSS
jgi:protocatechuate 3,4-dioxygenase beta subunit